MVDWVTVLFGVEPGVAIGLGLPDLEFDLDVLAAHPDLIVGDVSRCRCTKYSAARDSSAGVKLKAMEVFWVMMDVQLPRPISRIVFRCSEQTKTALLSEMQIHEGSVLSDELLQQAREAAKAYNERLTILVRQSIRQEEFLKSAPEMRKTFISPAIDESVNVIIYDPAIPPQRIRVDGSEHNSQLIEETIPHGGEDVPAAAVVKLAIIIGKDGKVLEIDPLAGPDPLISPAVDAVRRWKYRPTLLNGRPVEIETTVEVPFPPEK